MGRHTHTNGQPAMFAQRSPSAGGGRGLVLADVWSRDGRLLASVVQETALRHRS
ncbi:hypothetical protein [Streptomyces sp. NPDC047315]|uniref:hypothetical protein n=1 Tax=Streptomyces sp. NPDC047315 TaxID=3155142 RepID=UPI0033C3ACD6